MHKVKKPIHFLKVILAKQILRLYSDDLFVTIAGSEGKTFCVEACKAVLSKKFKTLSTDSSSSGLHSVSSAILKLNPKIKKAIIEVGLKQKGEIDQLLPLLKTKVAILTNISYAHSETLGDINEIFYEIEKLSKSLGKDGILILNNDDPISRKLADGFAGSVYYYGRDPKNCTVWAGNIGIENFSTIFELNYGVERVKINFKTLGLRQIYGALAAALVGILYNIPLTTIKLALESIEAPEHLLQPVQGPSGSIILDDTISCAPLGVDDAIDTLLAVPARRRILVLGEIRDLGVYSDKIHRSVAQRIYKEKLDLVLLGQGHTQMIADELLSLGYWEERLEFNLQNSQLVSKLLQTLGKGDVVLFKGSKYARFDEVVKRIIKK